MVSGGPNRDNENPYMVSTTALSIRSIGPAWVQTSPPVPGPVAEDRAELAVGRS